MITGAEMWDFYSQTQHMPGGHLVWTGFYGKDGYGRFIFRGKPVLVHRLVMKIQLGAEIPEGKWVMHREDCPKGCLNITHLSLGTPSENAVSAWLAGKANQPRLSISQRAQLEWLVAKGVPTRIATRVYGVHRNYLSDRRWKERSRTI